MTHWREIPIVHPSKGQPKFVLWVRLVLWNCWPAFNRIVKCLFHRATLRNDRIVISSDSIHPKLEYVHTTWLHFTLQGGQPRPGSGQSRGAPITSFDPFLYHCFWFVFVSLFFCSYHTLLLFTYV